MIMPSFPMFLYFHLKRVRKQVKTQEGNQQCDKTFAEGNSLNIFVMCDKNIPLLTVVLVVRYSCCFQYSDIEIFVKNGLYVKLKGPRLGRFIF